MSKKQQTLFQSWNTVKNSDHINRQNEADDLFNDEDDDLLCTVLEETCNGYALPHTSKIRIDVT